MKHTLIILCFFNLSYCYAQYMGGANDGDSYASVFGTKLNGDIVSSAIIYRAGNGDGYDMSSISSFLDSNTSTIYKGGIGDGFSESLSAEILSGSEITSIYNGANGDGFSNQTSASTTITGLNMSMLYMGSQGDGYAVNFLADILLQGFMTSLFEGGIGDGYSSEIVTSSFPLSIIDELVRLDVLLYPNPANNIVNIKPNGGIIITSIKLYDITGKKVATSLSADNTFNVSNLSEGIYLLNIFSENGSVTKKLVVKKE